MAAGVAGRALNPDQSAAVLDRPAHPVGGERIGPEPLVAVDRRRREHGHRQRVLEQPGDVLPAESGQRRRLAGERVRAVRAGQQRLVQVPAGGEEVRQRGPAHERGQQPAPLADLLDRRPEQHRGVGRGQPGYGCEAELKLAGAPLVLDRSRRQADVEKGVPHCLQRVAHAVQPHLGQELIAPLEHADRWRWRGEAGVLRRQLLRRADDDRELDLDAGQVVIPGRGQVAKHPAEQSAAVERHRLPVAEVDVAQHPSGPVCPWQHPEGGRVGHHDHVGETGELLDAEAAAAGERGHEHLVAGVQAVDGAGEVEPVGHRGDGGVGGQHLAARHAVLVDDRQPNGPQAKFADPGRDLLHHGRPLSGGRPVLCQPVTGYEPRLADAGKTRSIGAHPA